MFFYKLTLAYDGTNFYGSAYQKELRTVEGEIRKVLAVLLQSKEFDLAFAGRTDKGVHAIHQVASLSTAKAFFQPQTKLLLSLNKLLPNDIYIQKIQKMSHFFHARFDAKTRSYRYVLTLTPLNFFERNYVLSYHHPLVLKRVKEIINLFKGKHDFLSFSTSEKTHTVREIYHFTVRKMKNHVIFYIQANGFLRSQIRMMIACILQYNEQKISYEQIENWLLHPQKGIATKKVAAQGLFFDSVKY